MFLNNRKKNSQPIVGPLYQEKVFTEGSLHFQSLLADIEQSQLSIDFETYIFESDALGKQVATALAEAAKRGVKVRVIVDAVGTPLPLWNTTLAKILESAGVTFKVYHPFPWQLWNWSRSVIKLPFLLKWIYLLLKMPARNHRKICLIDNRIAYVGSFNISQLHLGYQEGGANWRDTSVRLVGANLKDLYEAFETAWHHRTIKERIREIFQHVHKDPIFRLNFSRHRRYILYKDLLRKIAKCKFRIWITNAYFIPDNFLLKRLKEAARRGIDVRILLPHKSDVALIPWASSTFYYSLLKAGVRIFEYLPSMLHAKSLILDEWMLVGSSNLDHLSLLHNLEVDVNIVTVDAKKCLEEQFLKDLKDAREISLESWHIARPWWQRMVGRVMLFFNFICNYLFIFWKSGSDSSS